MKISFQHQTVQESEKQYGENRVGGREGRSTVRGRGRSDEKRVQPGGGGSAGQGWEGILGATGERGKSLIEIQQEASHIDVGVTQDYMILMSNTMSEEDYAKMQEEGFDFGGMEPEEAVTILDKIKAELVRSGKNVAGYTDDLDLDTLAAALGSQALAQAVAESFARADIPLTQENLTLVSEAWAMAEQLQPLTEGSTGYLIDNEMEGELWNLYLAQNSGAENGSRNVPRYYAGEVQGYYTRSGEQVPDGELAGQIDEVIRRSGREVTEESRREAVWLLNNGLPLTAENLDRLEELEGIELPVDPERFGRAAADALAQGKNPLHADLSGKSENLYERAGRLADYYQSDEAWELTAGDLTARRQLEEIRLRMTAEVNIKLLKSGFSIDTAPMEKLVEALRQAEGELAEQYFPGDTMAVEKFRELQRTDSVVAELPGLPAEVLGTFAEGQSTGTLEGFHGEGKARQDALALAGERYETLMTAPRRDLGDNIRTAFRNIDEILGEMGQELTEENRRAARILAYNHMEITAENLESVRQADRQVQSVVEKLTPAATLRMIRDGINPLEKSFSELEEYFEGLPEEYKDASESYSRFLYGLERKHEITQEERESYIGIYRLIRQIEKGDGAAVGALVNTQAQLHFSNLLSAVRSGRFKTLDARVGEELGAVAELVRKGESISDQIGRAFAAEARNGLTEASYSQEAQADYRREQLEQYREAVTSADRECTAMLQRGQLSPGADNLLAAQALLEGEENLFGSTVSVKTDRNRRAAEEKKAIGQENAEGVGEAREEPGTGLLELLDNPEEFERQYAEELTLARAETEEATFEEADTSLDVRHMQLTHKQLTVAGALAENKEFFLPVYVGGRLTRVHLTLERDGAGAGMVEITMRPRDGWTLRGGFCFEDGQLRGILRTGGQKEVMETENIADIFRKEAGESWSVGDISVVTTDVGFAAAGRGTDAGTENIELYRVAKVFLHAVQQGELTDEN